MKSQVQPWLGWLAACSGCLMRAGSRFLPLPWQVQPQLAVHAPQHRLAPGLLLMPGAVVEQVKPMTWVKRHVALDEGDYPGVVAWHWPIAQR